LGRPHTRKMSSVAAVSSSHGNLLAVASEWYAWALDQGDPRVRDLPLMNPLHMVAFLVAYFAIVAALCRHTSTRGSGYRIRWLVIVHNAHLLALSAYMLFELVRQAVINNYRLWGNPVDRTEKGLGMARIIYIYYLSKVVEFVDTFIMALKQNYRQITFLHLYHHGSIFFIWWIIAYYAPGGESYFSAALNSFIHVIMYGYYLWSALTPKEETGDGSKPLGKPRWNEPAFYRKYITSMQLYQFCLMLCQATYNVVYPTEGFPSFCAWILFFYMFTMLGLFADFFRKAYLSSKGPQPGSAEQANGKTPQAARDTKKTK